MEQGQSWRRYKKRVVGNYLREEDKGRFPVMQCDVVDPGTGATFEALEKRGYILCRYEHVAGLGDPLVYIQITPAGRKLVRCATGEQREKPLPLGTLREWHWKADLKV